MRSRVSRAILLLLFLGAAGAAGYSLWQSELRYQHARTAARDFEAGADAASATAADLKASQQAYVAEGQDAATWVKRGGEALSALETQMAALRNGAVTPAAKAALQTATDQVAALVRLDVRAREYARGGEKLLASDLVFGDGAERLGVVAAQLGAARTAEGDAYDQDGARERRSQGTTAAALAAFAALLMTILTFAGAQRRDAAASEAPLSIAPPAAAPPAPSRVEPAAPVRSARSVADETPVRAAPSPPVRQPAPPTAAEMDWSAVARLCVDLGKVAESDELNALLGKAAGLLDAHGLVVWIRDGNASELKPGFAHGYPGGVVAAMGAVSENGDNAIAGAFRSGELQTASGDGARAGALAAPIVGPTGCVGVLAAEIRQGGETRPSVRAATLMVAAQLATLLNAAPPATEPPAAAVASHS